MKRKRVEQAWKSRRLSLLGCAAARSFAKLASGSDGPIPSSHEVEVTTTAQVWKTEVDSQS